MENEEFQEMEFRESFGDFLRRHREASGKTIDSVSRTTRIPKRYLQAFEESDSARFPEEAFTRGFLRAYALEIGIEVEETMARYERFKRSLMPTQIKEVRQPRAQSPLGDLGVAANISWKVPAVGLGVFVIIVALTVAVFFKRSQPSNRAAAAKVVEEVKPEEKPIEKAAEADAPAEVAPSVPLPTPVAPSTLVIKAKKKGTVSIRLDDHPVQEISLEADETKTFNVFREVEMKGPDRRTFEFLYNGKPLEVSGPSLKLFNRNLFTSASKP